MQQRLRNNMADKTKQKTTQKVGDIVKVYVNSSTHESITKEGVYTYGKICKVYEGLLVLTPLRGRHKAQHYRDIDQGVSFTGDCHIITRRYNRHRFNN